MNVVNLFINEPSNAELDLSNFDIALQYSIADIRDISKRNSAYSKTITLPGTKNNNYWLGNLFDINSDFTAFNPNKKTDAKLLVNGEVVIDGFLQLRKINKLVNADPEGNLIQYECVLYNNAVDLMTELGEKTLYELDLSEFNHVFNLTTITQSWEHTWEDGYVYPMYGMDGTLAQNADQYNIENFWPSPFYKMVFDKIVEDAGFGWTGSFRENTQFEKEIIAFIRDGNIYIDETEKNRRLFRAQVTDDTEVYAGIWPTSAGQVGSGTVVPFDDDSVTPNFDNDNHWDVVAYEWTIDRNGVYDIHVKLDLDFILNNNTGYSAVNVNGTPTNKQQAIKFKPRVQLWDGSSWTTLFNLPEIGQSPQGSGAPIPGQNYVLPTTISNGASYSMSAAWPEQEMTGLNLLENQKVRVVVRVDKIGPQNGSGYSNTYQTAGFYLGYVNSSTFVPISIPCYLKFNGDNNYIFNDSYTTEIVQGDTLDLGVFLPDKIKQKDLISDLIKRYNLYIEIDPDNDRLLRINERPNYYPPASSADTLDWTFKKDYSAEDNIELLSELQFKEMLFTWTSDDDIYNKEYETITGDVYGQYEWIFDNDFVKGVKEIKSPFSPTPIVKTSFEAFVAGIDPENPKVKPRVLYWGGLKNCNAWEIVNISSGSGTTTTQGFTQYPYAGHWDDPIEPTLDIHFGTPKFMFYSDYQQYPTNTMYNTYWSDYIDQIEDGRLVTSYFYLNETDIRYIKDNFNSKIFVKDSYYYINKIIDYKPLENTTTKVELIKINDGIKWVSEGDAFSEPITATACPTDIVAKRKGKTWYYVSQSGATVSQACCELIGGIYQDNGMCKVKKVPIRPNPPIKPFIEKRQLFGSNNTGWGVFMGSNNETPESIIRYYDSNWILRTGEWDDGGEWIDTEYWIDDETDPNIKIYSKYSRTFVFGDNNTLKSDNILVFGGDNNTINTENSGVFFGKNNQLLEGENNWIYGGDQNEIDGYNNILFNSYGSTVSGNSITLINSNQNYITASNVTLINVSNNLGGTQAGNTFSGGITQSDPFDIVPGSIYLGPNCYINIDTGDINTSGNIVPSGQMGLTYGTADDPSLTWFDGFDCGFWKANGERAFNAGVLGVTISTWDAKGLNMNNSTIEEHRFNWRRAINSTTVSDIDYVIELGGTNTGITVSLPTEFDTGRILYIKNLMDAAIPVGVEVGLAGTHSIDGLSQSLTLDQYDSVALCSNSSGWIII